MAVRDVSNFYDIAGNMCRLWVDVSTNGRITAAGCDNDSINPVWVQVLDINNVVLMEATVQPGEHPSLNVPGNPVWQTAKTITRYPA